MQILRVVSSGQNSDQVPASLSMFLPITESNNIKVSGLFVNQLSNHAKKSTRSGPLAPGPDLFKKKSFM